MGTGPTSAEPYPLSPGTAQHHMAYGVSFTRELCCIPIRTCFVKPTVVSHRLMNNFIANWFFSRQKAGHASLIIRDIQPGKPCFTSALQQPYISLQTNFWVSCGIIVVSILFGIHKNYHFVIQYHKGVNRKMTIWDQRHYCVISKSML